MPLTANISKTAVSQDGSTTVITDGTTYGAPNQLREDVAVYITAYKVDEDLVESPLTIATFDPETASSFTITNTEDGHYKFYFVIIDRWDIAVEYDQYDLVWSEAQEGFYEYINPSSTTGNAVTDVSYFAPVTDPTSKIANIGTSSAPGNITYQVYNTVIDYITAKCYATAMVKHAKEGCGENDDCGCNSKMGKSARRLHTLLTIMQISNTRERYLEAERMARTAEKFCDECGCLTE